MAMKRLARVLRARWRSLAVVALIGFIAAAAGTYFLNQNPSPRFVATASILFTPPEEATDIGADQIEAALENAFFAARLAVGTLPPDGSLQVLLAEDSPRLSFIAEASTPEEAREAAVDLRQQYLLFDPTVGGDVEGRLVEIDEETAQIADEIETLTVEPDPAVEEERALIQAQIGAVNARLADLLVLEASADAELRAAIAAERPRLQSTLDELQVQLAAVPPPPDALTPSEQLRLAALQARLDNLTTQYQQLYLRLQGVTGLGESEPPVVEDLTRQALSPWLVGAAGLVAGGILGLFALVLADRARRPVWLADDLPVPLLAQIPPRRLDDDGNGLWYDQPARGPRKSAIQFLRSAVEPDLAATGTTVALGAAGVPGPPLKALGEDLAAAISTAGRSVLVIDADFAHTDESNVHGTSLGHILSLVADRELFAQGLAPLLDALPPRREGLTVIPAGPAPPSPADALAGRQFRWLLDTASASHDLVIVVVGDLNRPEAQVAVQRAGRCIVAITPGEVTVPEADALLADIAQRQTAIVGGVFLETRERFVSETRRLDLYDAGPAPAPTPVRPTRRAPAPARPASTPPPRPAQRTPAPAPSAAAMPAEEPAPRAAPVEPPPPTRDEQQAPPPAPPAAPPPQPEVPAPDASKSAAAHRAGSVDGAGLEPGRGVLDAIEGARSQAAQDVIGDYLVARVERMLLTTTPAGEGNGSLLAAVHEDGIVPIRPLDGRPTAGDWIAGELVESDAELGRSAAKAVRRVLGAEGSVPHAIDAWLSAHFFERHLERTNGSPQILHLRSDGGTVQVLVVAQRLDRDMIRTIGLDFLAPLVSELESRAASARGEGDQDAVTAVRGELAEIKRFRTALLEMAGPSRTGGMVWEPDWARGVRRNLAPLQVRDLLPFPVLKDSEVEALTPAG